MNSREFQCVCSRAGEPNNSLFGAEVGGHPRAHDGVDSIELRRLDQNVGHGGRAADHELEVAERREERRTPATVDVPAFALFKAEGAEETAQLRVGVLGRNGATLVIPLIMVSIVSSAC